MTVKKQPVPTCSPKTAVAYARYSSAGQRDVSIEQQLRDIRAYAKREGYTIVHEYADRAKSGFRHSEARTEFQSMMAASKRGGFDTVIVWKTDRFSRDREDAAIFKGQLRRVGVRVVPAMEPIPEGSAGVLLEGMLEATAEWYSRALSENVIRGLSDNAKRCLYNGASVYGYTKGPDGRYAVVPEEAAVVRQIFDLYAGNHSAASIVRIISGQGIMNTRGAPFSLNAILYMLHNPRYIGTYIWGDIRIEGGMPAIIDKYVFEEVQQKLQNKSRHYETGIVEYLLTGKAFCGHCGAMMVGDCGTSKTGDRHYYYSCQTHKARKGCDKKSVRKESLESAVMDHILDNVLQEPEIQRIAAAVMDAFQKSLADSPLPAAERDLEEVTREIDNINTAIAHGIWSSSTAGKLRELEETADTLRAKVDALRYSESQLLDPQRVLFHLRHCRDGNRSDPEYRRYIFRTFLNAVFVFDDHLKIAINNVEGATQIKLTDLPKSSDELTSGLLRESYPNSALMITVYRIAFQNKKMA